MSSKLNIKRQGNLIEITPVEAVLLIAQSQFTFRRTIDKLDEWDRRVGRIAGEEEQLYQIEDDDRMIIPAGLGSRLFQNLKQEGIPYEYEDLRTRELPEPDFENIFKHGYQLRPGQAELLGKLVTYDCGRIGNPTGDGKTFIITMMTLMYPKSKILIVTAGLSAFDGLYRRLLDITPDVGRVGGGRCEISRVTLCNKDSLHRVPAEEYDICLTDECHTVATTSVAPKFSKVCNARIFGFSATQTGRGDNSDLLTEAVFGPIIHEIPYQVSQSRGNISKIQVTAYECSKGPDTSDMTQDVTRKRHAYWRNTYRNKLIAHIAKNLIPKDEQQLIVVDTIEHALRIRKYLPEWEVVYRPADKERMLGFIYQNLINEDELLTRSRLREIEIEFEQGTLLRAIANSVWHKAVDFPRLEWLIRADGGRSRMASIQIAGRLARLHDDNVKQLVDFDDKFDRVCYNRSMERMRHYRNQGWSVTKQAITLP